MTKLKTIACAILSTIGSCQPAALLAGPTTAPVQAPKVFSIGPDALVSPAGAAVYTVSSAPATVQVSLLNLLDHPTDWLSEHDSWNFGDPEDSTVTDPRTGQTVHLSTGLPGPAAAHQYLSAGTYTITLTRTLPNAQSQIMIAKIVVPPAKRTVFYIGPTGNDVNPGTDPNHPLKTAAAALKLLGDHTEFRFQRGSVYKLQPEFPMKHRDMVLDCFGDPQLPLPVLQRTPAAGVAPDDAMVFTTWPGQTADITIRHLRIDSPWSPAFTADKYAYHAPAATFGILRGINLTVSDCEFDNLVEGPHGDPAANGLLLLRNRQVDPLGIPSRTLWLEGRSVVAIGNTACNSVNESPLRAAATGAIDGLIAFNDIAQQLDPAHNRATAKAAITLRTLADVMVFGNRITNGEFSFDPHSDTAQDLRFVAENNAVFNSQIDIKPNVRQAIFRGNSIKRDGGPCITINPGSNDPTEWIENLQLVNNTGQGWLSNGRMMQMNDHTALQLRGFVFDPAKNPYTLFASTRPATTH